MADLNQFDIPRMSSGQDRKCTKNSDCNEGLRTGWSGYCDADGERTWWVRPGHGTTELCNKSVDYAPPNVWEEDTKHPSNTTPFDLSKPRYPGKLTQGKRTALESFSRAFPGPVRWRLVACLFNAATGMTTGASVQLVDKIASDDVTSAAVFSVSSQGLLLYQEGLGVSGDRHVWADATGKQRTPISDFGLYGAIRLAPDGLRMATPMVRKNGGTPLWVWELGGGTRAPLTSGKDTSPDSPVWSADSRTIYFFQFDKSNDGEIWQVPVDGSRPEQKLFPSANDTLPTDVTSDGKWLLYEEAPKGTIGQPPAQLKAYPLASGLEGFTALPAVDWFTNVRLRPGANDWLAYQSSESGRAEVYLTRFPRPGSKFQVSQAGGRQAVWSKDGKSLYYLDNLQRLTVVPVQASRDSVQLGAAKTLFPSGIRHTISTGGYDVTRDGRFLLVTSAMDSTAPVVLVTNWQAGLKK